MLPNAAGKVELPDLFRELARRELNEIHVEAGHKLNGSLLNEGMVDELLLYLAPDVIGDAARGMFNLPELTDLSGRRAREDPGRADGGRRSARDCPLRVSKALGVTCSPE